MDLEPSQDQAMLRDSVARLLGDRYGFVDRGRYAMEPAGFSRAMWGSYAEQGLLGLPFAETVGGSGLGAVETMFVMQEMGRALVLEPYLPSVVIAGALLCERDDLLRPLVAGTLIPVLAHAEVQARHDLANVLTTARRDGAAWVLDGCKVLVPCGDVADLLIVSARATDGTLCLFLVPPDAPGLLRQGHLTIDGQRAATITLSAVRLEAAALLGEAGGAGLMIARAAALGIAALCAEAVGVMERMQDLTVDYLKTRQQFGRLIGSNQALQHRAVEMLVALEQARSMALYAAMMAAAPAAERDRAMSAAKLQIHRSMRFLSQQAIQLHGGIGMTEEFAIGHLFRRSAMIEQTLGDTPHHLARLVAVGGLLSARS